MERSEILSPMVEAQVAAHPKLSGLSDYRDLQQLLKRLSEAAGQLLKEVDELDGRLRRTSVLDAPANDHWEGTGTGAARPSGMRHLA